MKNKDKFKLYVNNTLVGFFSQKEALSYMISMLNDMNTTYMSMDAIKKWVFTACDIVENTFSEIKSPSLKKKLNSIKKFMPKIKTHQKMIKYIHDLILSLEGMGTLTNFHINKTNINPEKFLMKDLKV